MNQIDIKIRGRFLELGDVSISFEMITDFFREEVGPGLYTFPFSIPKTPHNRALFGFTDVMESVSEFFTAEPCQIHLFGIAWMPATLSIQESTSEGFFDCDIVGGAQSKISDFLNKSLKELDYGDYNDWTIPETTRFVVGYFNPSTGQSVQIQISKTFAGIGSPLTYTLAWDTNAQTTVQNLVDAINADTATHKGHAEIVSVPSGSPDGVFVKISGTEGIFYSTPYLIGGTSLRWNPLFDSFSYDQSPQQGHMLNMTKEPYRFIYEHLFGRMPWRFPMVYAPNFYNSAENTYPGENYSGLINAFDAVLPGPVNRPTFLYTSFTTWAAPNIYPVCPMPLISFILEKVFAQIGLAVDTDLFDDEEMASLIFLNLTTNDLFWQTGHPDPTLVWGWYYDFRKIVPDITVGDLLRGIKNLFTLKYTWNFGDGRFVITKKKDILRRRRSKDITQKMISAIGIRKDDIGTGLKFAYDFDSSDTMIQDAIKDLSDYNIRDAVQELDDLPASGNQTNDVRKVNALSQYFLVDAQTLNSWDYFSDALSDYTTGDGATVLSTPVTPLLMGRDVQKRLGDLMGDPESLQKVLLPRLGNEGNSTYWKLPPHTFGARIAFYRGLQDGIAHSFHSGEDLDALPGPKVYPMAGVDVYDYYGVKKWDKSLGWDSENGLVETFAKEYIEFYQKKKPIYAQALFSIDDFLEYLDVEHYRIESTELLPRKLNFTASNTSDSSLIPVLLDLYKR